MRRTAFYLLTALSAFGICFARQNVSAQTVSVKTRDKANNAIACKDENLLLVWDNIKNEFKDYSIADLTKIAGNNCENLFKVKQVIDLNGDDQKEVIISRIADCPVFINCTLWIFRKKGNMYRTIFNAREIERYTLAETKTKNYTDIQLRTHKTGTSHYFQLLKFNGTKYTPRKCWREDYAVPDERGNFYELSKPQILSEKCGK